ncbi:MAG: hypothetical protein IT373_35030 [Polyangiaceae bacterium]|nr:hypothetical protein [Polyangiaceae bacterium]
MTASPNTVPARPLRLRALVGALAAGLAAGGALVAACSSDSSSTGTTTTTTTTTTSSTTQTGGAGGTTTSSTTTSSGGSAQGGAGGTGGAGAAWPTCDTQPGTAQALTIPEIWQADPATPTEVWVNDAIVTAVSRDGCVPGQACQIFLQADSTYASLAAGAHHGIKLFVSGPTAQYFTGVQVDDVVDVLAHAWRFNLDTQNELLLQVNSQLRGCAKTVGNLAAQPITGVTLAELTVQAYEQDIGPLLIQVDTVSGTPGLPLETFGLWETGQFNDAGISEVVSLSPFFLPNAVFTGLGNGQIAFASVTGVFGLFVPPPAGPKFKEIYPRSMADVVQ